ncbi:MAG: molybdenum cofactor biosynthesis protein MoaE [Dermatophilus congolensis]|nr:molybdenum cofactor biosynthesis protein MoaE [Dermatophilus congolensis]
MKARVHSGVRGEPLDLQEAVDLVRDPRVGAVVTFLGLVRDHDSGKGVEGLGYSAHPSATAHLNEVAEEAAAFEGVHAVAAVHRTGDLAIGDAAVVLAVGAEHRGQAFDACRYLIDELKARVPIWKHQVFDDGSDEWVGTP